MLLMFKVFVYGNFIKDHKYNQYYLQGKTLLGKGSIEEYRAYILGSLYGAIPENGGRVQGEVYEIDQAALAKLDFLHNLGTTFSRSIVDVKMENGETLQAETYIWNGGVS